MTGSSSKARASVVANLGMSRTVARMTCMDASRATSGVRVPSSVMTHSRAPTRGACTPRGKPTIEAQTKSRFTGQRLLGQRVRLVFLKFCRRSLDTGASSARKRSKRIVPPLVFEDRQKPPVRAPLNSPTPCVHVPRSVLHHDEKFGAVWVDTMLPAVEGTTIENCVASVRVQDAIFHHLHGIHGTRRRRAWPLRPICEPARARPVGHRSGARLPK